MGQGKVWLASFGAVGFGKLLWAVSRVGGLSLWIGSRGNVRHDKGWYGMESPVAASRGFVVDKLQKGIARWQKQK